MLFTDTWQTEIGTESGTETGDNPDDDLVESPESESEVSESSRKAAIPGYQIAVNQDR